MADRNIDIKETDFGVQPVTEYLIRRALDSAGEDFSISVPGIDDAYGPGTDIAFRDVNGFVTTREYNIGPDGYRTLITGVSKLADVIRKAPQKTLMYMSMTPIEFSDFEIANTNARGKVSYENLDYIPKIALCDEKDGTGGWSVGAVIKELAGMMGLQVVCNVRPYWLKQAMADIQSSYFDTIVSLVSFLRPTIYVDEDTLYVLNRPIRGGEVSFDRIMDVTQKEIFNYNSKGANIRVEGGLGVWKREKHRGNADAEREATITSTFGGETGGQLYCRLGGDVYAVSKMLGIGADALANWGGTVFGNSGDVYQINADMNLPMSDETKTTETYRLDPFGGNKALLARTAVTMNHVLGNPPVKTHESIEVYAYDFLDEMYDRARLVKKVSRVGRYSWQLVMVGGGGSTRFYKEKVDDIVEGWVYAPNGNLLVEYMARETDCFKVGDFLVELDLADYYWTREGEEPPDGYYVRAVVQEKVIRYRQMTHDLYQKATYERTLGGVRRKLGDGRHTSSTENIKGRVPRQPKSFRKMQVYAEQASKTAEVPAIVVGNPNIIDWADAESVLSEIKRTQVEYDYSIQRQLVIPMDIPVDVGWKVTFGALPAGRNEEIPAVEVFDGMISSWSKRKDARGVSMQTVIVLEGKVKR